MRDDKKCECGKPATTSIMGCWVCVPCKERAKQAISRNVFERDADVTVRVGNDRSKMMKLVKSFGAKWHYVDSTHTEYLVM